MSNREIDEETSAMSGLALRFALFCALTFVSTAFIAIPYLTIR